MSEQTKCDHPRLHTSLSGALSGTDWTCRDCGAAVGLQSQAPSPAHGGTSAIRVADDCLDSVLSAAECDCIPNEFQCVKHGAMDELRTLRARLAALTRENEALRTDRELQRGYIADVRAEIAAERARAEKARGDAVARVPSVDEMMHAFDEKQGKLDDPFRRNLWLAELAAVRDLVLRALARAQEGRGT